MIPFMMPVAQFFGAGYDVGNAALFDGSTGYLSRTPSYVGNRKTWVLSWWMKLGPYGLAYGASYTPILSANAATYSDHLFLDEQGGVGEGKIRFLGNESTWVTTHTPILRDGGGWYHCVYALDTTEAIQANRGRLWINGVLADADVAGHALDAQYGFSNNVLHAIGRKSWIAGGYIDKYLAQVAFFDGLTITDPETDGLGEYDDNGVWRPKDVSSLTFGTNGFLLDFANGGALGTDVSGNGNNWTVNGTITQVVDTPGAGDDQNYATLNPLWSWSGASRMSEGNLRYDGSDVSAWKTATATIIPSSGKWYWEIEAVNAAYIDIGLTSVEKRSGITNHSQGAGVIAIDGYYGAFHDEDGGSGVAYMSPVASGDVIGLAWDVDTGTLWMSRNGVWTDGDGSDSSAIVLAEIEAGIITSAACTGKTSDLWAPWVSTITNANFRFKAHPASWSYGAPTGFYALQSANLPEPAIKDGSQHFEVLTYAGNSSVQTIAGTDWGGDDQLVWGKARTIAFDHFLFDSVRGAGGWIAANLSNAEAAEGAFTGFTDTGWTFNGAGSAVNCNNAGYPFVAWRFRAGTSGANTNGSTTSTVSANAEGGFSIVTYTGTGSGATVGHGLTQAPELVITKARSAAHDWGVYSAGVGATKYLSLNTSAAATTLTAAWNDNAPTSTVFSVGSAGLTNAASDTYVAYCWHSVPGYSKIGQWTSTGAALFVPLDFRARFLLIKQVDGPANWVMIDTIRSPVNTVHNSVFADAVSAEDAVTERLRIYSNGFELLGGANQPNSSGTYIYLAIAEHPFGGANTTPVPAR